MKISRRRSHEHSPSRTFIRLFMLPYIRQSKAGNWVSEVQSVLFEDSNNNETTIFTFMKISRRRSHEHLLSRTFIRLFTLPYKRQSKAGNWVSEVQSVSWRFLVFEVIWRVVWYIHTYIIGHYNPSVRIIVS